MTDLKEYGPYGARNVSVNMGRFIMIMKGFALWIIVSFSVWGFWWLLDRAIQIQNGGPL